MPLYRRSFEENLESLYEELKLAIQWKRPSILLTVHRSQLGRDKARRALEQRLGMLHQNIIEVGIDSQHPDPVKRILELKNAEQSVFFVSNLDWGGGQDGKDAYRALNIQREQFVENQIRVVFWLTLNEATHLARHAPDFWAFRHRVIEFTSPRQAAAFTLPVGILTWHVSQSMDSIEEIKNKIKSREKLLKGLPQGAESLSARLELFYNLGYYHWLLGDSQRARQFFKGGLAQVNSAELSTFTAWFQNGEANLQYEAGQYTQACELYQRVLESQPLDGMVGMNLAFSLCALGRKHEAIQLSQRALRAEARSASLLNSQGYLYLATGRMDEAIASLLGASELSPHKHAYLVSLAVCYSLIGLTDEALQQLTSARSQADSRGFYIDIVEQAILENHEAALSKLGAALFAGWLSQLEVQRDPNLNILLEPAQIRNLIRSMDVK